MAKKGEGVVDFKFAQREMQLLHRAAEKWAPKLSRVYSGVRGCGYAVPEMLADRDRLKGTDDAAGLIAMLDDQSDLFAEQNGEAGQLTLSPAQQRVLWYALRNYREHIASLKADDERAGYPTKAHDRDLGLIGQYDADEYTVDGGLLERLWGEGWESRPDPSDPAQLSVV